MATQTGTWLDFLPLQHKQNVLTLVRRLEEEKSVKNQYMQLYQEAKDQLGQLQLKYNQLKDQNQLLKQQIHNSFSIVAEVRKNFKNTATAAKAKAKPKPKPKPKNEDWQDDDSSEAEEEVEELEQTAPVNKTLSAEKPPKPQLPSTPIMHLTQRKTNRKAPQEMNRSQVSSSRSQELDSLRKEVRQLQEEKKAKEHREQSIKQKHRLVDQIKNRYKKQVSEQGDESATFQEEDYSIIETRKEESYKPPAKKQQSLQKSKENRRSDNVAPIPQSRPQVESSAAKGPQVTEADYSDALDILNYYNQ